MLNVIYNCDNKIFLKSLFIKCINYAKNTHNFLAKKFIDPSDI